METNELHTPLWSTINAKLHIDSLDNWLKNNIKNPLGRQVITNL